MICQGGVWALGWADRLPPAWGCPVRKTKYSVTLTEAQRAELRAFVGAGAAPARQPICALILHAADQGEGGGVRADATSVLLSGPADQGSETAEANP